MIGLGASIETSTRSASVSVGTSSDQTERVLERERAHAADLIPALDALLLARGARAEDLSLIAVGIGPGSYTGVRIGCATAFGLSRATGIPLVAVPSTSALPWRNTAPGEESCVLLDGRGGAAYFAHYRREDDGVVACTPPTVVPYAEVESLLPAGIAIFADDTIAKAAKLSPATRERLRLGEVPRSSALLELAFLQFASVGPTPVADVRPLYLRPFATR